MTIKIPSEPLFVIYILQQAGFEVYLVGGAVRDLIVEALQELDPQGDRSVTKPVTDFDFATNARPSEIQQLLPESFYENKFGTVSIAYKNLVEQLQDQGWQLAAENLQATMQLYQEKLHPDSLLDLTEGKKIHASLNQQTQKLRRQRQEKLAQKLQIQPPPFEITTYRSESLYQDYRRPSQVKWGRSIDEDLNRRDFTINAMALLVNTQVLDKLFKPEQLLPAKISLTKDQYQLIDPHQGMKDLTQQKINTVGRPEDRFEEDALRMLRAIRFSVQLEMELSSMVLKAIAKHHQLIEHISLERTRDEFLKMLRSDYPDVAIDLLDKTNLLSIILPEIQAGKGVEQGGHHTTTVWEHSLDTIKHCPSKDPIVRLAALLHDVGKPATYQEQEDQITFYNHELVGARITKKVAQRLKLSNKQTKRLITLVRHHMFYYQPYQTDAAVRRMMRRIGLNNIDDMLALREGDRLGSGAKKTSWRLEELKKRMIEQLNQPLDSTDLAISGHDLIKDLGLKPGPKIGKILKQLLEEVLENPKLNQKQTLLTRAKQLS